MIGEVIVLLGVVALGVAFIVEAPRGGTHHPVDLGSDFFPWVVGLAVIVLALIRAAMLAAGRGEPPPEDGPRWRLVVPMLAAIVAYPLVWPLGYVPVTAVFVLVTMRVAGVRSWRALVLAAGLYTAASYLVFEELLYVELP